MCIHPKNKSLFKKKHIDQDVFMCPVHILYLVKQLGSMLLFIQTAGNILPSSNVWSVEVLSEIELGLLMLSGVKYNLLLVGCDSSLPHRKQNDQETFYTQVLSAACFD